jgi:deoxyribonuclease-4
MCIDTAHAYVAGYDITTPQKVNTFITYVANHVGIENIGLLHCNDTKKQLGSHLDEHAIPGYGNIGMQALYHMVHHSQLAHVPVIFEMPSLDESLEQDIIQQFTDMEII